MSGKACTHHHTCSGKPCSKHHTCSRRKLYRPLLIGVGSVVLVIAFTVFLVWAILRPSKPRFILQDVTVYNFTVSSSPPYTLTTNMQITISSRNPNDRIGIHYLKLDAFATYRNQPITLRFLLPSHYQGHRDDTVWSPLVCGDTVPVSPYLQQLLCQDLNVGAVLVNIKIDGRVKWKVGTWISGTYQLYVNCPAYIKFSERNAAVAVASVMKFQLVQGCSVETGLA